MLAFDQSLTIQGHTVYRDEKSVNTFYVLPNQPSFRIDPNGNPVFKFLKYRTPIDRGNGKRGGGFLIADVEFVVPDDTLKKIVAELQAMLDQQFKSSGRPAPKVITATPYFKRGAANVRLLDSGGTMVEKIVNPASPSLYGRFITPFTVEFSEQGVTLAEAALQGKGGAVQVDYDLFTDVKLPPLKVDVWFYANKFYEFHQHVDIDWKLWSEDDYRESIQESWRSSEGGDVKVDPGSVTDRKVIDAVTDWGWKTLEDGVKRMVLGDIAGVSEDNRKVPQGIENVWRDVTISKVASFHRTFTQGQAMEWNPAPRGTLPNITSLKGKDGKPLRWQDFAETVDLDDPFFRQINVAMQVNADFQNLPLHSVEIHLSYPKQGGGKEIFEEAFTNPNDIKKFAAYVVPGQSQYEWFYEVNYKGQSKAYKSPVKKSDEKHLTVNVDDTGIISLQLISGDLDFDQIKAAQVTVQYEDAENKVAKIERQFTLDKDHPEQRFQQVLFQPVRKDVRYKVKYLMRNGKEFQTDWVSETPPTLVINDPWSATKTVGIRATGDLVDKVETIFLDLTYTDELNKYTQTKSVALNENDPFFDWDFPVINETGGKVVYSGTIKFKDGSEEPIVQTETTTSTILVGPKVMGFLEVEVLPDLIDFDLVKLVKVSLQYQDPGNNLNAKKDVVFRPGATDSVTWKVELKDKNKTEYKWQAAFFMVDGSQKKTDWETTSDSTIIPQLPA